MAMNNEELRLLEDKAEALIARAVDEGADVDFQDVRFRMEVGSRYRVQRPFTIAMALLEDGIAVAKRERAKRVSRRPFVIRIKNLLNIFKIGK